MSAELNDRKRQEAIALLAQGTADELSKAVGEFGVAREATDVKRPEVSLVMVRGRIGGDGAAFNVGEATVVRAVVQCGGITGFGARLGRDVRAARDAAILDAVWQMDTLRAAVEASVLAPIRCRLAEARTAASRAVATSKVEFFTVAREAS